MKIGADVQEGTPDWDMGIDIPGVVPLLAPARHILAILTALGTETPVAVIAAHADCPSATALRHLRHLARIGLAEASKADADCFRAAPGPGPFRAAELTAEGHAAAIAWHLACVHEAARVLGALALPTGERITPNPERPPRSFIDRHTALAWFSAERENLEAVLEFAWRLGEDVATWHLALLMLNVSCFTGPWKQREHVHERGVAAARRIKHRGALAMFEEAAGKLELTGGHPVSARERHQRALMMRSTDADALGVVRSLNALGVSFLREGALREARELFDWTREFAEDLGDTEFLAYALMNLGAVHARTGPAEVAVKELEQAITLLRADGREPYIANALEDLAVAHRTSGDLERAEQSALDAIDAAVAAGIPTFLPGALIEQAHAMVARGHLRVALALLNEAHGIYCELGDQPRAERTRTRTERLGRAAATVTPPPPPRAPSPSCPHL